MAIQVELWKKEIINALYRKNDFLPFSTDVSSEVLSGKVVHIPNSGGASGAQRNRTTVPASVIQRSDTDVTYTLDHFTSDPMLVTAMEQAEISYTKMQSMIDENGEMMLALSGDAILEYWSRNVPNTAVYRVSTTGGAKSVAGLTGTRKKLTAADLRSAQTLLDTQDVSKDNRYVIITPDMHQDLLEDADIKNVFAFTAVDYAAGKLPMYASFKIIVRSKTVRLATAGTIILPDPGTATLGTDNFAGIFFQKACVEHALGELKIFMRNDDPTSYGDIMSMLIRTGGRGRRADNKGVGLLVQVP